MAAELPNFTNKRWETPLTAPTPISRKQSKLSNADRLVLIATTALITATATFGWAILMNGQHRLPVLRINFYTPGEI